MNISEQICSTLSQLGVDAAFGMPGTQLIPLYAALKHSKIRKIVAGDELAAAFMANGYYRATGRPALLITIPGPGFTYTLTGLAEAKQDSAALVYLLVRKNQPAGGELAFQVVDQKGMAESVVKHYITVSDTREVADSLSRAYRAATTGEPGPVIVEIDLGLLTMPAADAEQSPKTPAEMFPDVSAAKEICDRIAASKKPLIILGQGAQEGSREALKLVGLLGCPVATTISGRGVIAEDQRFVVANDFGLYGVDIVNELVGQSDLVLAFGCKFTHNGTGGFRLKLATEKLVYIDASPEVPQRNYRASLVCKADVPTMLKLLNGCIRREGTPSSWTVAEIESWQQRFQAELRAGRPHYPRAVECVPQRISALFDTLRNFLPRESTVVTDSGLHQYLTRCYYQVFCSRGLIVPSDFQSMGYGIPAAIGAKVGRPDRPAVVITGDGSFLKTSMELLTARRDNLPLVVVVFNDSVLGLIREQQTDMVGETFGVDLNNPDFEHLAAAIGMEYFRLSGTYEQDLRDALAADRGAIVEVLLTQSTARRLGLATSRLRNRTKRSVRRIFSGLFSRRRT